MRMCAPSIDEQTDRNNGGAYEKWREAVLRFMSAVKPRLSGYVLVGEVTDGELTDGQASGETEVGETAGPRRKVVMSLVSETECCENEEEVALSDGGVYGE